MTQFLTSAAAVAFSLRRNGPRAWLAGMLLVAGCQGATEDQPSSHFTDPTASTPPEVSTSAPAQSVVMPNVTGMASANALERLGELGISSSWGRPIIVRCSTRPRTVVTQRPKAGTPIDAGTLVHIRTAELDLQAFRGPCNPPEGDRGPVAGPDAALARRFYRFAADPSLGAAFTSGEVWVGIEDGLTSVGLGQGERHDLAAWQMDTAYAEASGPFSPLDTLASSGGYYELHRGVAPSCGSGKRPVPAELVGLRAISLTAPSDVTGACMEWWAVTLFLDSHDQIAGVALRLGSP